MMGFVFVMVSTFSAVAGILLGANFAAQATRSESVEKVQPLHAEAAPPRFISPEVFVYPLQSGNSLDGYLVVRFVLPLEANAAEAVGVQDDLVVADAFYASMFSMRDWDSESDTLPSIDQLASGFLETANRSAGGTRFQSALVQQFDLFEPNTTRRKNVRDRFGATEVDSTPKKPAH